jgi:hypothetical protein
MQQEHKECKVFSADVVGVHKVMLLHQTTAPRLGATEEMMRYSSIVLP